MGVHTVALSGATELKPKTLKRVQNYVGFEVFTAVTMKNGVLWDVTPCDSCKNLRFGGT
jgi:hypothetical protein